LAEAVPFGPGEKLIYALKVMGVKAGECELSVQESPRPGGPPSWLLRAELVTTAPFKWAYPVRDKAEVVVEAKTLRPKRFWLHLEEGNYRKQRSVDLAKTPLAARTHDFLSFLYALRAEPWKVGHVAKLAVWSEQAVVELPIRVASMRMVKSGVGQRSCFILSPVNALQIKGHPVEVEMAISDDADRYPVSLVAQSSLARLSAVLKTVQAKRR